MEQSLITCKTPLEEHVLILMEQIEQEQDKVFNLEVENKKLNERISNIENYLLTSRPTSRPIQSHVSPQVFMAKEFYNFKKKVKENKNGNTSL